LTQCHGSDLLPLRLPFTHRPAVSFLTSPTFRRVFTGFASTAWPFRCERPLCYAFRRLSMAVSRFADRQDRSLRAGRSSNRMPLRTTAIHLDSKPVAGYLTRLGAVSHRSLSHDSDFACSDDARPSSAEPVNYASYSCSFEPLSEGPSHPA
jgi:hypothetical protein